jgi:hypothetical protein
MTSEWTYDASGLQYVVMERFEREAVSKLRELCQHNQAGLLRTNTLQHLGRDVRQRSRFLGLQRVECLLSVPCILLPTTGPRSCAEEIA